MHKLKDKVSREVAKMYKDLEFTVRADGWGKKVFSKVREAPFNLSPPLFGHCPNSNYPPPPHSNGHSGALFFRRDFPILKGCMLLETVTH